MPDPELRPRVQVSTPDWHGPDGGAHDTDGDTEREPARTAAGSRESRSSRHRRRCHASLRDRPEPERRVAVRGQPRVNPAKVRAASHARVAVGTAAPIAASSAAAQEAVARAGHIWAGVRRQALPLLVTMAVVGADAFATAPVRDAASSQGVSDVYLVRPDSYLVFAPFSNVLDALTLASAGQNVAIVLGLVVAWVALRLGRPDKRRRGPSASLLSLALLLACTFAAYAAAALLPRPMAYLESPDPDVVRVDFHSHTAASQDARRTFSAEANRAWHRDGGYDVAYVTDHHTFAGAEQGLAADPSSGRGGVMLLPGIEVGWRGEHVGILGAERTCRRILAPDLHELDPAALAASTRHGARIPAMVWNHPRDARLASLPLAAAASPAGMNAIEESNGAPHSIGGVREKRPQIVSLARRHDLQLIAGSDNHGWGYAPPNWTLLRIEHWRDLDRDRLADDIEDALRRGGPGATRVVERAAEDPGASRAALAFSAVLVPWRMLTTLSPAERRMWLVWTWGLAGLRAGWRRRRTRAVPPDAMPVR